MIVNFSFSFIVGEKIYYISFNASNYSIPVGQISNPQGLAYLQQVVCNEKKKDK